MGRIDYVGGGFTPFATSNLADSAKSVWGGWKDLGSNMHQLHYIRFDHADDFTQAACDLFESYDDEGGNYSPGWLLLGQNDEFSLISHYQWGTDRGLIIDRYHDI